jgi:hypothetical protein
MTKIKKRMKKNIKKTHVFGYIDLTPAFHALVHVRRPETHCWHLCCLGHNCRLLLPPETFCETMGSYIHIIHNDMGLASADKVVARLFLKEAGIKCTGSSRDEALVAALADVFASVFKKSPIKRRRGTDRESYKMHLLAKNSGPIWKPQAMQKLVQSDYESGSKQLLESVVPLQLGYKL